MKAKKLSKVQLKTFAKMKNNIWYTAYDLGVRLTTLDALYHRNLLSRKSGLGAYSFPRTNIWYSKK